MIHRIMDMPSLAGVSEADARRMVDDLAGLGLARRHDGFFSLRQDAVCYPIEVLEAMRPSLLALRRARRFGRRNNLSDITFARSHLPPGSFVTLDYPLARLTGYQSAWWYYVCVDDPGAFAAFLKGSGFREERLGRVVVAPKIGRFGDTNRRLVLDCLADGGRGYCDAIALLMERKKSRPGRAPFDATDVNQVLRHVSNARERAARGVKA